MIPFLSLKDVTALHGAEINEAVTRVVNGGWYLQGKENEKFEADYAKFIGTKHCIGCANGLDALIGIDGLRQEVVATGIEGGVTVVVEGVGGKCDDRQFGLCGLDESRGLETVHDGHLDVH